VAKHSQAETENRLLESLDEGPNRIGVSAQAAANELAFVLNHVCTAPDTKRYPHQSKPVSRIP